MSFLEFVVKHRIEITTLSLEHLRLVLWSMMFSLLIGIPLGVLLARHPKVESGRTRNE